MAAVGISFTMTELFIAVWIPLIAFVGFRIIAHYKSRQAPTGLSKRATSLWKFESPYWCTLRI
jgi:hypothetical protein